MSDLLQPKHAELEQRGQGAAIVIGLGILFILSRQGGIGSIFGAPGNGEPAPGSDGIGQAGSLNLTLTNPIDKLPGQGAGVSAVSFNYRGPAQSIIVAWGIKPSSGLFGINYDNGAHLIADPVAGWARHAVTVAASQDFVPYSFDFRSAPVANIIMPNANVVQFGRDGNTVGLNFGSADVWIWLASGAAVGAQTDPSNPLATNEIAVTREANILVISTQANVFNLIAPAPVAAGASGASLLFA